MGLDFSSIPTKVNVGEVIKILDDNEKEAIDEYIKEEGQVKAEPNYVEEQEEAHRTQKLDKDGGPRRSGRTRVPNRQFKDYDLYMTVEEEEAMLANMEESALDEEEDEEVLAAVAHYIMVHYEEKESLKKKKRKYKPKAGQYWLEAGIKRFDKEGETVVTKELNQVNTYGVFEPQHAQDLSDDDKKKALLLLIFLRQKKNGAVKAKSCANGNP